MKSLLKLFVKATLFVAIGYLPFILLHVAITPEDHHQNWRYLLWKHGLNVYDYRKAYDLLSVDVEFRNSMRGMTRDELRRFFPDLRPLEQSNRYQRHYVQFFNGRDAAWFGDSHWAVEFENGCVASIRPMKG